MENFRILSDLLEEESGRSLAELYRRHYFRGLPACAMPVSPPTPRHRSMAPSDMRETRAGRLVPGDESHLLDRRLPASRQRLTTCWRGRASSTVPETMRIVFTGVCRRRRHSPTVARPVTAMGLAHDRIDDVAITGHGGALRGFRIRRLHAAAERLSVVVMFNHEADAHAAALFVMRAALGRPSRPRRWRPRPTRAGPAAYLEPTSGLSVEVMTHGNAVLASLGGGPRGVVGGRGRRGSFGGE